MNIIDNELPEGNQLRPPTAAGGPVKTNLLKRIMRKICRSIGFNTTRKGQVTQVTIVLVNLTVEETKQLIMENTGINILL